MVRLRNQKRSKKNMHVNQYIFRSRFGSDMFGWSSLVVVVTVATAGLVSESADRSSARISISPDSQGSPDPADSARTGATGAAGAAAFLRTNSLDSSANS